MSANRYFHVSCGLRGGYMPDSVYVVAVKSRRELKEVIEGEAAPLRNSDYVGLSKRNLASIVAQVWKDKRQGILPYCLAYRAPSQDHYPYGIFISPATRGDYLEHLESNDE